MNSTHPKLIFLVVISISVLSFIGVGSIALSLFLHTYADPAILTALITITSGLIGALTAMLTNTRTTPPATDTTTTTTTKTVAPPVQSAGPIEVVAPPGEPLKVEEVKK